jgi:cytosine deaminase
MCSGAVLLYKIPEVVIGENQTFKGPEEYLMSRGVKTVVLNNQRCIDMMSAFIKQKPELWNEDIGE